MLSTDTLRTYGANVEEGLGRCMGNEALYLRLVETIFSDTTLPKLKEALEQGDYKQAFECAHALKGVYGNLSLTPLYDPIVTMTEALRPQQPVEVTQLLDEVLSQMERLEALRD